MRDLYELVNEFFELIKISPKNRKRIKIGFLIIVILAIAFLTIKNNFFNTDSDGVNQTNVNVNNAEKTLVNTGNNNKIVQDNSNKYFVNKDTNIRETIEDYLRNPDIYYNFFTIRKEGYNPYYITVYLKSDSIYFESFKIKNERVKIINSLKARDVEFNVSSWCFKPITVSSWLYEPSMYNKYLLFTGCKPHACDSEFGIYAYSLRYNEGYAISTNDTIGFTVVNLPSKAEVMCDFEYIILGQRPELLNLVLAKGSIFDFLPSRKLPNLLDSVKIKDKILIKVKELIKDTLKDLESINKLNIYGIYRENFFKSGLCWLSATAFNDYFRDYVIYSFFNDNLELIYSFRSSYLVGGTGDIYIIKEGLANKIKIYYLMIVKDCGGNSGRQDIWMYKIVKNKLLKISDINFIENYLRRFEIDNYSIQ